MATKAKRRLDLPDDRPASFDEHGHHVALNPADVHGRYRRARDWVYLGLIVVFLVLPWTRVGGEQTILIDIPQRRFAFFGLTFWAHDVPLMFFVFGIMTIGLTLLTATLGRVWCGWACPQTVFIDRVYRVVERWIEGNHVQRMHLKDAPMSWKKFRKKGLKWTAFWFISTNIAHSFTAYFVGAERLVGMSLSAPWEHWTPFLFVTILTGILMFDFGWFREQFCIIMCPYGRIQSVLMDEHSVAILYDEQRGEPRKGTEPEGKAHGDCINCYKCVAVCPTGIDIRRGVQLECVACTACMDACDEIMRNTNRPEGLIRYASEESIRGRRTRFVRPRSIIYAAFLVAFIVGLNVSVAQREPVDVKFIRAIESPYTQNIHDDGSVEIVNHYRIHLRNQAFDPVRIDIRVEGADGQVTTVAPTFPISVEGGDTAKEHVFFKFPDDVTTTGKAVVDVMLTIDAEDGETLTMREPVTLVGPLKRSGDG